MLVPEKLSVNGEKFGALVEAYYDPQKRVCEVLKKEGSSRGENFEWEEEIIEPEATMKEMSPIVDLLPTVRGH